MKQVKAHFESNMIDGDDVNDCGGCTFSAPDVLEYLQWAIPDFLSQQRAELRKEIEKLPFIEVPEMGDGFTESQAYYKRADILALINKED